jgi:hypothetical protein
MFHSTVLANASSLYSASQPFLSEAAVNGVSAVYMQGFEGANPPSSVLSIKPVCAGCSLASESSGDSAGNGTGAVRRIETRQGMPVGSVQGLFYWDSSMTSMAETVALFTMG